MSRCRSCDAPLRWERTESGKRIPLDAEPNPAGNVQIGVFGGEPVALVLGPADREAARVAGLPLYMPHHATCPNAAAHRPSDRLS